MPSYCYVLIVCISRMENCVFVLLRVAPFKYTRPNEDSLKNKKKFMRYMLVGYTAGKPASSTAPMPWMVGAVSRTIHCK